MKGLQPRWEPVICNCLARCNNKLPNRKAGDIAKSLLSRPGARENRSRFGKESSAGVREHDATANPIELLDAVTLSSSAAIWRAGGRLGQVQLAGGLGDMLFVGDRDKNPELVKRHDLIILSL